jgi:cell division protein FtsL
MKRILVVVVALVALGAIVMALTACSTGQPAANQAQQNINSATQAQQKAIDDAVNQAQSAVKDAAKAAGGWDARVTGFQVNQELSDLGRQLDDAAKQTGDAKKQAVQKVADAFGQVLDKAKQAAASAPANSPEKAGLDQLVTTMETAQQSLANALKQ